MALKEYEELRKIDVMPFCEVREGKDDKGKKIDLYYLNWAKCVDLLHENGAQKVYFEPLLNEHGSSLFSSDKVFTDKNGITNSCYEVGVHVVIDDLEFDMRGALMNGSNPVKDNSLTAQRVWNCQTRLFVKGVALRTGLGFNLWLKTEQNEQYSGEDDKEKHNIMVIKERVQELYTTVHKRKSVADIAKALNMTKDEVASMFGYFDTLDSFEKKLGAIK